MRCKCFKATTRVVIVKKVSLLTSCLLSVQDGQPGQGGGGCARVRSCLPTLWCCPSIPVPLTPFCTPFHLHFYFLFYFPHPAQPVHKRNLFRKPYPYTKPAFRSTRTSLTGARPLVRLFTDGDIPDDSVPPALTFAEIEVLHHKLVAAGPMKDTKREVGYLKWVCKAYEGALRRRREGVLRAKPEKEEVRALHKEEEEHSLEDATD